MSTTFTTLKIDATMMRELFTDVFKGYNVTALEKLKQEIAKRHLQEDLYRLYKLDRKDSADVTNLDTLINDYESGFQTALMYLQCYYYFSDNDDVDGLNAKRMNECMSRYELTKAAFPEYSNDNVVTTAMGIVSRG